MATQGIWTPRNEDEAYAADRTVRFIRKLSHIKGGKWNGKPFELLPWEDQVIRTVFGTLKEDGFRQIRTSYIEIPRKNGKALDKNTTILTGRGWITMGEVQEGDYVHAPDGFLTRVNWVSEDQFDKTYLVKFAAGQEIVAGASHQWTVVDRYGDKKLKKNGKVVARWFPELVKTTEEMASSLSCGNRTTHRDRRYSVRVPGRLVRAAVDDLPVDPYVLGAWLGDGSKSGGSVAGIDDGVFREIEDAGILPGRTHTKYVRSFLALAPALRKLGVLNNKHVPEQYLLASEGQRMALLQGFMDTDGSVMLTGPKKIPRCEFSNTNRQLADSVLFLARSLGWKATLVEGRAKLYGVDKGPKYRVCWTAWKDRPPFRLQRKVDRLWDVPVAQTRASTNQIVSIEEIDPVPMRCISVEHPSHCYLVGEGLVPTHNSELAAAVALYMLLADSEPYAEVYGAAFDRPQAEMVFDVAAAMVRASPILDKRCKIIDYQKRIIVTEGKGKGSFYRAIPADAAGSHGFNASAIIFDEVHTQPSRDLWDVLTTATAAREQPLTFAITTAGFDKLSICWELHDYARQVLEGVIDDESWYAAIYNAGEKDDWKDLEVWRKANPSFGITINEDYAREQIKRATGSPAYENDMKRLHLNIWTAQESRFIQMNEWDANKQVVDERALRGKEAYLALDLSSTTDLSALALVFPPDNPDHGDYQVVMRHWTPQLRLEERERRDKAPYQHWADEGILSVCDGPVIDYEEIEREIQRLTLLYKIKQIAIDRLFNAEYMAQRVENYGLTVERFGQSYLDMTFPTKELLRLVLQHRLAHGGNPLLRWQADNMMVEMDAAGNVKPTKSKSTRRIDGVVAMIMGLSLALRHEPGYDLLESVR